MKRLYVKNDPVGAFRSRLRECENGCIEYTGGRTSAGYGHAWNGSGLIYAHRFSLELIIGPIPKEILVLHDCDNPPCCNPAHLFMGDDAENAADKCRKGRIPSGEKSPKAKLTDAQCEEIRKRYVLGMGRILAREYGVASNLITRIAQRTHRAPKTDPQ